MKLLAMSSLGSDVVNFDRIDLGLYCSIEAVNA